MPQLIFPLSFTFSFPFPFPFSFTLLFCLLGSTSVLAAGEAPPRRPGVWLMPPAAHDGRQLRELFTHPEAWEATRAQVDVLGYADHALARQFSDAELRSWFALLATWKLPLGLEVGAIKEWGPTGEAAFQVGRKHWDRFRALGGEIHALAMDEPLVCCRKHLGKPDTYAVEETARYVQLVRQYDARLQVGDIEPYPFISVPDLVLWVDAVQEHLAAEQVRPLDFLRLDVDWVAFTLAHRGSWSEVKTLEEACRKRHLPFQLIYWASGQPHLARRQLADASTWYTAIMQQGGDYALVGGRPDAFILESWLDAPPQALPETGEWTFTRAALDFTRRFAGPR